MTDIYNLSTERAFKESDNSKWNVQDCLNYSLENSKMEDPFIPNAVMVLLANKDNDGNIQYRKIVSNLGYVHQVALLQTVLSDEVDESR